MIVIWKIEHNQVFSNNTDAKGGSNEWNQPTDWTRKRGHLVSPSVKDIPGRPANSRTVQLKDGMIGCHQCLHSAHRKCSGTSRHAAKSTCLCLACTFHTYAHMPPHFIPASTQPPIAMTKYNLASNVNNSFAFSEEIKLFWGLSSGVCDNLAEKKAASILCHLYQLSLSMHNTHSAAII